MHDFTFNLNCYRNCPLIATLRTLFAAIRAQNKKPKMSDEFEDQEEQEDQDNMDK